MRWQNFCVGMAVRNRPCRLGKDGKGKECHPRSQIVRFLVRSSEMRSQIAAETLISMARSL